MKVVTAAEMARVEALAYAEGASEHAFMEAAGEGVAAFTEGFIKQHKISGNVILLCGKGNNGGDAYVAGSLLLKKGYRVLAYQVGDKEGGSPLCRENRARFKESGGEVLSVSALKGSFPSDGVIIDGLLGTGLKGAPIEEFSTFIRFANKSAMPVIAVDIPSGVNGDTGAVEGEAIKAAVTVFLGFPKVGFFLLSGWDYVGKLVSVDFGLTEKAKEAAFASMELFTPEAYHKMLPTIARSCHKYERGYVVGIAGSKEMSGAARLSSESALRGGAGIVRLLYPEGMESFLVSAMPELIKTSYDPSVVDPVVEMVNGAKAVFIGPGIGVNETTRGLLRKLLPLIKIPCVLDADALTLFSEADIPLPKETIMTPHIGEMRRLLKRKNHQPVTMDFLHECHSFAKEKKVTLLLKGGPSFILQEGRSFVVNPYGDQGMATAGSGDVLTGLIAALLSQKVSPFEAAVLGAYMHAAAGEAAAAEKTSYCMTATDLIRHFPEIFKALS